MKNNYNFTVIFEFSLKKTEIPKNILFCVSKLTQKLKL